ncbi:MAG TPA: hypothetical protein VF984_00885 [Actinomycetota bacterium]
MVRRTLLAVLAASLGLVAAASPAAAAAVPSGERALGQATVEPFYNAEQAGQIGYLLAPSKAKGYKANQIHAWAPIYLPVYPVGSTAAPDGLICTHTPVENCPTHGDAVAAAAMALEPGVYGGGVLGHDHVMDFPGGDDFHIAWEPILVLFTDSTLVDTHLLTDAQIEDAVDSGHARLVPVPQLTFVCAVVSQSVYDQATPLVP